MIWKRLDEDNRLVPSAVAGINNGGRETDYGILAIVVDFFFGCASRKKNNGHLPSCTRAQPIIGSI